MLCLGVGRAGSAGTTTMMTDVWTKRGAGPLALYCHEGSYAYDICDTVLARYQKALDDVCLFLDVQRGSLPTISIYLCEVLEPDADGTLPEGNTQLDLENATIRTIVTSESVGAYPEFELTLLVLHLTQGPAAPEGRFWDEGLAGYLAGRGGASYYAEAPARVQKIREEGQLRPLPVVLRQYQDHRSPVATTTAVAFVT